PGCPPSTSCAPCRWPPTTATPWPPPRPRWPPSAAPRTSPPTAAPSPPASTPGERSHDRLGARDRRAGAGQGRPGRDGAVRRPPARRAGAAQHQRDPLRGARRGPRRPGRGGQGPGAAPLPGPGGDRAARGPGPARRPRVRRHLGGQRLQRGPPAAPARLRRPRPLGAGGGADLRHAPAAGQGQRHPAGDQGPAPRPSADRVAEAAADLTFWCSPNNPTGEATGPEVLAAVCAAAPGLVVVDEAYGEFGSSHAAGLLSRHPNLFVTRTFSKAFRMAGLRLGYLLADPAVVDGIRLVRLAYHLAAPPQGGGRGAP